MRKACIIIIGLVMLIYCVSVVYADLTATEGFAIDMSSAGAGTDFTVAFDPTEITGGTTWDDGGDASVEWTIDLSGTDPVVTFGSATVSVTGTILSSVGFDGVGAVDLDYGSADITDHTFTTNDCTFIVDGGITVSTGDTITLGVVAWNSGDNIDGEVIANDTIDNDSIDWADMADLDTDGAVVWGNLAEGELADSTVVSADIKDDTIDSADYAAGSIDDEHIADDTIQEPALNVTNAGEEGIDNYVLSYNHAGTNFTWVEMAGGANYVTNDADDTMAGDLTLDDDDDGTALTVRADAAGTGATVGLLITTDDDDSANYDPFEIRDDSGTGNDLLFFIDHTGAITTGEWQGTAIADAYVPDDITIDTAGVGTHVTVTDNEDQNEENEVPFVEDASGPGNVGLESDSGFTYNPSTGTLTAAAFAGDLTGDVTGNADTATTATVATTVTITDNEDTAENNPLVFVAGADPDGGDLGLETDGTAYYTPSTGIITATGFAGALTGAVTGNADTATTATNEVVNDATTGTYYLGMYAEDTGASLPIYTDGSLAYTQATGTLAATEFSGGGASLTSVNAATITDNLIVMADLNQDSEPSDGDILTYDETGGNFDWITPNGGTDITADLEEEAHAAEHAVSGADTVFPADPGEDKYLMWDDDPGALVWASGSAGGDAWGDAVDADILPTGNDNTYDLGSEAASFADIWWDGTGHGNLTGALTGNADTATTGTHVTVTDNEDQNEENEVPFVEDASGPGNVGLESDSGFTYNPSTGVLTAAGFAGALTGNVTGTASGNATTSTKLDDFGTPDDNTDLNATTTYHGLLPKLPNDATKVIDGSGSWVNIEDLADEIAAGIAEGELADSIIVTGDIKDGEVAAGDLNATLDLSSKTITLPARPANQEHHLATTIWNPNALYDDDTQVCLWVKTSAAITITNIEVTCDADPDTELEFDLKWADAFIGLANAAVIDELDTTSGAASISEGFDDATVASGKCIYIEFQADPDSGITQIGIDVTFDYD